VVITGDRRPPTADRRPETADRRPPTADRRLFFLYQQKNPYFCPPKAKKEPGIMEKNTIIGEINGFLVEEFEIEEQLIKPEASWKEIGIDSLDFVDIVVIIEKSYGFKLKGEEMANIKTLGQFYDYIYQRIQNQN
jgi:acyl carrier protein